MTAKRTILTALTAFILSLNHGCMWGRVKVNDPTVADRAKQIEPGVTTVSELDGILKAQPTLRIPGESTTLLGYTYSDTKNNGLLLIVANFIRTTTITGTVYVEADSSSKIVKMVHIPAKHEVPWRFWPFGD